MDDDAIEAAEAKGEEGVKDLLNGLSAACNDDDKDPDVAEAILDAFLRMMSPEVGDLLCESKTFPWIGMVIESQMEEAAVIEVLFAILTKIITTPEKQDFFKGADDESYSYIPLILKAMKEHSEGEETLIEYACLVIEKIALDHEDNVKIFLKGGAEERLKEAESIITNARNQKYVVQARSALKLC
uniref:Beta-catenin-like protein 1 N-terminal domain-containing protein n=1 Tax=Chaetoceros debilis TaxID=122233 RepID=A0A7S3VH54_9STRA|mmetsp:Transcript_577/g.917  ORF Transcript_577/g.917 Transcript_577/m.917 type:complete len:186 (+) Transcript_577:127-684(+)